MPFSSRLAIAPRRHHCHLRVPSRDRRCRCILQRAPISGTGPSSLVLHPRFYSISSAIPQAVIAPLSKNILDSICLPGIRKRETPQFPSHPGLRPIQNDNRCRLGHACTDTPARSRHQSSNIPNIGSFHLRSLDRSFSNVKYVRRTGRRFPKRTGCPENSHRWTTFPQVVSGYEATRLFLTLDSSDLFKAPVVQAVLLKSSSRKSHLHHRPYQIILDTAHANLTSPQTSLQPQQASHQGHQPPHSLLEKVSRCKKLAWLFSLPASRPKTQPCENTYTVVCLSVNSKDP